MSPRISSLLICIVLSLVLTPLVGCSGPAGPEEESVHDCTGVELLPLRLWKSDRSAVAMLFTAEECHSGEALVDFDESAFAIAEDGRPLSSEAVPRILPSEGLRVYVTLMLDLSGSTAPNLAELQAGARRFVDEILIEQALDNVYIGLEAFDGSAEPIEIQRPTRDASVLERQIGGLTDFNVSDPGATNLYGATRLGVQRLQERQQQVMADNYGGVVTTGYLVLFTDGGDTARRESVDKARRAVADARVFDADQGAQPTVRTLAVALKGQDYTPGALTDLVGGQKWVSEADLAQLNQVFGQVGHQIARRIKGTYLLAYCSASRAGDHAVSLELADRRSNNLGFDFNADDFAGGCSAEFFETACSSRQCGGFNCGACEDATEVCSGAESGQCHPRSGHNPGGGTDCRRDGCAGSQVCNRSTGRCEAAREDCRQTGCPSGYVCNTSQLRCEPLQNDCRRTGCPEGFKCNTTNGACSRRTKACLRTVPNTSPCDILCQDCPGTMNCGFASFSHADELQTSCSPPGPGTQLDPCRETADCARGYSCMDTPGVLDRPRCVRFCRYDVVDSTQCDMADNQECIRILPNSNWGVCLPR